MALITAVMVAPLIAKILSHTDRDLTLKPEGRIGWRDI